MTSWRLSEQAKREMLAAAADPRLRQFGADEAPCGKTPAENFELLLLMLKNLSPFLERQLRYRPLPRPGRFLL
jgi:hypothetical protein